MVLAKGVLQTGRAHFRKRCFLRLGKEHLAAPSVGVVAIAIFGGDVEIATESYFVFGAVVFGEKLVQLFVPLEFVSKFLGPYGLPVWTIDRDYFDAVSADGEYSRGLGNPTKLPSESLKADF